MAEQVFSRKCFKFFVHSEDVAEVKSQILQRMPEYHFGGKTRDFDAWVQSVYFDSADFTVYSARLLAKPASQLIRYRWYGGQSAADSSAAAPGFLEQKLKMHGVQSIKRRFPLHYSQVADYLDGADLDLAAGGNASACASTRDDAGMDVGHSSSAMPAATTLSASARAIATEIQAQASPLLLRPTLLVKYRRSCYQRHSASSLRISLDEDLCMSRVDPKTWFQTPAGARDHVFFPHAVLEIKVSTSSLDEQLSIPTWLSNLVGAHLLHFADDFSKYLHGAANLFAAAVSRVPAWLDEVASLCPSQSFGPRHTNSTRGGELHGSAMGHETITVLASPIDAVAATCDTAAAATDARHESKSNYEASSLDTTSESSGGAHSPPPLPSRSCHGDEPLAALAVKRDLEAPISCARRCWIALLNLLFALAGLGGTFDHVSLFRAEQNALASAETEAARAGQALLSVKPKSPVLKFAFSNERTMLKWNRLCLFVSIIGLSLLAFQWQSAEYVTGTAFCIFGCLLMLRALIMFRWRSTQLQRRSTRSFDDPVGAYLLTAGLVASQIAFLVYLIRMKGSATDGVWARVAG